jgi:hypothetical protein
VKFYMEVDLNSTVTYESLFYVLPIASMTVGNNFDKFNRV